MDEILKTIADATRYFALGQDAVTAIEALFAEREKALSLNDAKAVRDQIDVFHGVIQTADATLQGLRDDPKVAEKAAK